MPKVSRNGGGGAGRKKKKQPAAPEEVFGGFGASQINSSAKSKKKGPGSKTAAGTVKAGPPAKQKKKKGKKKYVPKPSPPLPGYHVRATADEKNPKIYSVKMPDRIGPEILAWSFWSDSSNSKLTVDPDSATLTRKIPLAGRTVYFVATRYHDASLAAGKFNALGPNNEVDEDFTLTYNEYGSEAWELEWKMEGVSIKSGKKTKYEFKMELKTKAKGKAGLKQGPTGRYKKDIVCKFDGLEEWSIRVENAKDQVRTSVACVHLPHLMIVVNIAPCSGA